MSEREKKLVTLFGIALFVVLNFFGYKFYLDQKQQTATQLKQAEDHLKEARNYQEKYSSIEDEMVWMTDHTPEPRPNQQVPSELEQFVVNQAASNQLTVKRESIKEVIEGGTFNRAKVEFVVNGMEENLYRWLDRIQAPDQLRGITRILLSPQRDDDTKIDCTVEVDQWFIPAGAGAPTGATPEVQPEQSDAPPGDGPIATEPPKTQGQ